MPEQPVSILGFYIKRNIGLFLIFHIVAIADLKIAKSGADKQALENNLVKENRIHIKVSNLYIPVSISARRINPIICRGPYFSECLFPSSYYTPGGHW